MYRKSTFTGQYLNFNSHHPYNVKTGIIRCLQHQTKDISSDSEVYQEEIKNSRESPLQQLLESKTSAPSNKNERYMKTHHSLSALCQRPIWKNSKDMQSMWYQDNVHYQHNSSEVSLLYQTPTGIQHDQKLCLTLAVVVEYTKVRHATPKSKVGLLGFMAYQPL